MIVFKENKNFQEGALIALNKYVSWTSFDLVNKVRIILKKKYKQNIKVGHSGTLDPFADGLLLLCTGKWTKKIHTYQSLEKEYLAYIKLGATTPSFDRETKINQTFSTKHLSEKFIIDKSTKFIGKIRQTPPQFSAVKVNGIRMYKKARIGEKEKLIPRIVHIRDINIVLYEKINQLLKVKIICSKGTYIRALARDLGRELLCGAYISNLTRTRIGEYCLHKSFSIDDFEKVIKKFN